MSFTRLFVITVLSSTMLAGCDGKSDNQSSSTFGIRETSTQNSGGSNGNSEVSGNENTVVTPPTPTPPEPVEVANKCASSLPADGWLTKDDLKYQVSAVSEKVVRIRVGHKELPQDASWAVLPESHKALPCDQLENDEFRGLKTSALEVEASKYTISRSAIATVFFCGRTKPRQNSQRVER